MGTFTPFVPAPRPSTRLPLSIGFNRASYRVATGTVLRYRVILRNTSRKAFRFPRCPIYVESRNELFWEVGLGTYLPPSSGARATVTR